MHHVNTFDFERTWWRLFKKRLVRTNFHIYVFIKLKIIEDIMDDIVHCNNIAFMRFSRYLQEANCFAVGPACWKEMKKIQLLHKKRPQGEIHSNSAK